MRTLVAFVLLLALLAPMTVHAGKRVALVVGNGNYTFSPLKNPTNDARDMAAKLRGLDFEVTLLTDASQRQMEQEIRDFGRNLSDADVRLFFFAGHGMQLQGVNYLIPVDADVAQEHDVKYESVDAGRVLDSMDRAGRGVNILVLDACRNNPFARSFRSTRSGLARMDAPSGTVIVYATAPGNVALDGDGDNGMFTKHLLASIDQPGLTIEQIFKRAGKGVMSESDGMQEPWISLSLYDDIYLKGGAQVALAVPQTPASSPSLPTRTPFSGTREVTTSGSCAIVGMTPEQAIHLAKQRARAAAIEKAAGVRVSSSSLVTDGQMAAQFFKAFTRGFIVKEAARWSISSYQNEPGKPPIPQYDVKLTATVVVPKQRNRFYGLKGTLNRKLFRAGEKATLDVSTNRPARIAVFNLMADGNVAMIFPVGQEDILTPGGNEMVRLPSRDSGIELAMFTLPGHKLDAEGFFVAALDGKNGTVWQNAFESGHSMPLEEFFARYAEVADMAENMILPYEVIAGK